MFDDRRLTIEDIVDLAHRRKRARLSDAIDPRVVCGEGGWWQGATGIGAPAYDPFGPDGANYNRLISPAAIDPVGGSVPHRAYLCEVSPASPRP